MLYFPSIDSCYRNEFRANIVGITDDGVVLDATAFYPKGGGQDADGGTLESGGRIYVVKDVLKRRDDVIHVLETAEGLTVGDEVTGRIEWDSRYGNMRMHTAQHLISAIVKDMYGADTVGNQLYPTRARMDFKSLTKQDFDPGAVLDAFGNMLEKDSRLSISFEERGRLVSDPKVRVSLDRLPPHITKLRVVEIDGFDICPCAGTHVRSLGELSPIEIGRAKSKGRGRIRVEYWFKE